MSWDSFWKEDLDPLDWAESDNEKDKRKQEERLDDIMNDAENVVVSVPVYDENGRVIGYNKTGDIADGLDKDYSSLWGQLDDATGKTIDPITGEVTYENKVSDLDTWMTENDYAMYDPMAREASTFDPITGEEIFGDFTNGTMDSMQGVIDQLTNGPSGMELDQAQAYAAELMGIDPAEYSNVMAGMLEASTTDIADQQGMSEKERAAREKINRNQLRQSEVLATRMVDNIRASTGSVSRSYAAADQAISRIQDQAMQQETTMYNDDLARKNQQLAASMQQYEQMVNAGSMNANQYLGILMQGKSQALQGYATQVNTMMQTNQQYLQMYQADAQAVQANIDNIYKAINAEIGIDDKAMSDIERQYQLEMAPILTQMDNALMQLQMAESEISTFNLLEFMVGAGTLTAGAYFANPGLVTAGSTMMGSSF